MSTIIFQKNYNHHNQGIYLYDDGSMEFIIYCFNSTEYHSKEVPKEDVKQLYEVLKKHFENEK